MSPETVLYAVLNALARLDTMDPTAIGFGFDGYTEEEISAALDELQRGGYIHGNKLTEKDASCWQVSSCSSAAM